MKAEVTYNVEWCDPLAGTVRRVQADQLISLICQAYINFKAGYQLLDKCTEPLMLTPQACLLCVSLSMTDTVCRVAVQVDAG